jgi:protein-disulfide isomerase
VAAGLTDLFVVPDACGEGLAFTGARLDEAKLGLLGAAALAPALHIRGPLDAPVTVVEYGDFERRFCGRAEPEVRELLRDFFDVRYVWRHLPLSDVHLPAEPAAEAAEAAAAQDAFWPMHDLLLAHQDALDSADLVGYAERLGMGVQRFASDLDACLRAERIAEDVEGADLSGVTGTPTFFINRRRHYGS